jgi:hypothetical protein
MLQPRQAVHRIQRKVDKYFGRLFLEKTSDASRNGPYKCHISTSVLFKLTVHRLTDINTKLLN